MPPFNLGAFLRPSQLKPNHLNRAVFSNPLQEQASISPADFCYQLLSQNLLICVTDIAIHTARARVKP